MSEIIECKICKCKMEKFTKAKKERIACSSSCHNTLRSIGKIDPRSFEKTNCKNCEIEMDKYDSHVKNNKKYFSKDLRKYCSEKCAGEARKVFYTIECCFCKKEFKTNNTYKRKTCSRECYRANRELFPTNAKYHGPHFNKTQEIIFNNDTKTIKIAKKDRSIIYDSCNYCCNFKNSKRSSCDNKSCYNKQHREKCKARVSNKKKSLIDMKGGVCLYCKKSYDLPAMCFHHRKSEEKLFTLDSSNLEDYSWEDILKELDKCDLLCHNCHAEHHERERNLKYIESKVKIPKDRIKRRMRGKLGKKKMIKKLGGGCKICGYKTKYLQSMSFDHINPENKSFELNVNAFIYYDDNQLQEEANKCRLLCMNCHISLNPTR